MTGRGYIRYAERAGSSGPSEDRVFVGSHFVAVLDGASSPVPSDHNGGWLASILGGEIHARLSRRPDADLTDTVAKCLTDIAAEHHLVPGAAPSTTISVVTWNRSTVEAFVLGDSPVAVQLVDGRVEVVRDDRLDLVAVLERRRYQEAAARASFGTTPVTEWRALAEAQRQARNREGGYWIGEADPEAARHAIRRAWPIDQVAGVLVVTDGVAAGPDTYAVPPTWADTIDTARRDPKDLVDSVHNAEEGDAEGRRWPRSKRHDDKTAVFIDLTH